MPLLSFHFSFIRLGPLRSRQFRVLYLLFFAPLLALTLYIPSVVYKVCSSINMPCAILMDARQSRMITFKLVSGRGKCFSSDMKREIVIPRRLRESSVKRKIYSARHDFVIYREMRKIEDGIYTRRPIFQRRTILILFSLYTLMLREI